MIPRIESWNVVPVCAAIRLAVFLKPVCCDANNVLQPCVKFRQISVGRAFFWGSLP